MSKTKAIVYLIEYLAAVWIISALIVYVIDAQAGVIRGATLTTCVVFGITVWSSLYIDYRSRITIGTMVLSEDTFDQTRLYIVSKRTKADKYGYLYTLVNADWLLGRNSDYLEKTLVERTEFDKIGALEPYVIAALQGKHHD